MVAASRFTRMPESTPAVECSDFDMHTETTYSVCDVLLWGGKRQMAVAISTFSIVQFVL